MSRSPLDRRSDAGNSLVGTLLPLALLVAMVTGGIALMVSTESHTPPPAAEIRIGPIALQECPTRAHAGADGTVHCAGLPVLNSGQAKGLAHCTLFDGTSGTAVFDMSGTQVGSIALAPGQTDELLIRIEGAKKPTLPIAECSSVPLLAD
jgi:hypothetical protein